MIQYNAGFGLITGVASLWLSVVDETTNWLAGDLGVSVGMCAIHIVDYSDGAAATFPVTRGGDSGDLVQGGEPEVGTHARMHISTLTDRGHDDAISQGRALCSLGQTGLWSGSGGIRASETRWHKREAKFLQILKRALNFI